MKNKQHSSTRTLQHSNQITVGIITISDRASAGDYDDLGGPALKEAAQKARWQVLAEGIVPDDVRRIQETIRSFARQGCGLILTTGGTGISARDVTPEATMAVVERAMPGLSERMRFEGARITPFAALSRGVSGIRGKSLIVNLPGSPKGAVESLDAILELIPLIVQLMRP